MQTWGDVVAACTVGLERAGAPALPAGLDGVAVAGGPDGVLGAAAALAVWRLAGQAPDAAGTVLVEPMHEVLPECSDKAAALLEAILSPSPQPALCQEWCRLAAAAGVCAPPGLTALLFEYTRQWKFDAEADPVLGARLPFWLAWRRSLDGTSLPDTIEADWSDPDLSRRADALRRMRADPAAGRAALMAVWKTEPADARARLLSALCIGLSEDDEPFLEDALDDRSSRVRSEAADLLKHLPASRWAARMATRAKAAVQFRPGRLLSRDTLAVSLPVPDDAARRDGLDAKGAGAGTALLRQLVAAAPLSTWDGPAPDRWIRAAMAGDWAELLVVNWAKLAARLDDMAWLRAVLAVLKDTPKQPPWTGVALASIMPALPPAEQENAILFELHNGPRPTPVLLRWYNHGWSSSLTAAVLEWLAKADARGSDRSVQHEIASALISLATRGQVASAKRLAVMAARLPEDTVPQLRDAFDTAVTTLSLRHAMHQEFRR